MNMNSRMPKKFVASAVMAITLPLGNISHANSLGDKLADMYESLSDTTMTNTTKARMWETSRRGGVTFGGITVKNKVMQMPDLVNWDAPSVKGSCSGIDFYAGSFSFISGDELMNFLRTIASNAATYAFYLAMEAMSSTVTQTMNRLQEKVQELNQMVSDSCQLAQGIVTDTKQVYQNMRSNEAMLQGLESTAAVSDLFGTFSTGDNTSRASKATGRPGADQEVLYHNVTWKAMKDGNVHSWFGTSSSQEFLEYIMSATGTVLIKPPSGDDEEAIVEIRPNTLTLYDLVHGGELTKYQCNDITGINGLPSDNCLNLNTQQVANFQGMKTMIESEFIGANKILDIMAQNGTLQQSQMDAFGVIPPTMHGMLFSLARNADRNFAESFLSSYAETIAIASAYDLISGFYEAVSISVTNNPTIESAEAMDRIRTYRLKIDSDYRAMMAEAPSMSDLFASYNQYAEASGRLTRSHTTPGGH